MAASPFKTAAPDEQKLQMSFGLLLTDAFTRSSRLAGRTTVSVRGVGKKPIERPLDGAFIFVGLAAGNYTVQVRSSGPTEPGRPTPDRPYYLDLDLPIILPMPHALWPAYPDVFLANQNLPLDDPGQPAAYRAQRGTAALRPTPWYPFPEGATLVRGTVRSGNVPLNGATVRRAPGDQSFVTGPDGEFVLFFNRMQGASQGIVLEATHPLHPLTNTNGTLHRGTTVVYDINMP